MFNLFRKKPMQVSIGTEENYSVKSNGSISGYKLWFRIVLPAALIFGITFLYPIDKIYMPIEIPQVGEIASRDVLAPFDFPIFKSDDELRRDRQLVIANLRPVVTLDTLMANAIESRIRYFFKISESLNSKYANPLQFIHVMHAEFPSIPDSLITGVKSNLKNRVFSKACIGVIDSVMEMGIYSDINNLPLESSGLVTLDIRGLLKTIARDQLTDTSEARIYVAAQIQNMLPAQPTTQVIAEGLIWHFVEPNLDFDEDATEINRNIELDAIKNDKGWVYKSEKIIRTNERVNELHRDKLLSLARYSKTSLRQQGFWHFILPPLGRLFFIVFPIMLFGFYLYYFRRNIFDSDTALTLFAFLFAILVIILNIVMGQTYLSPYLVPITIASMLITIAYDLETGLFLTFSASLLMGILAGFKLDIVFVSMATGTVAAFAVKQVRHRHEFYRSILYLSIVYFGTVYVIESVKLTPPVDLWRHVGFAVINGFLSPILTIGFLPLVETTFKLTTDITLLELSDLNRPLLKRLALEAPGTYHHSIMIGSLAEDAAKAINANSLLARVGSYYHDIGKMLKPEYFVENQMGAKNKHEKLAPSMSALILEAHVKEGKELAQKHGLPECIIDFITGHHGTSVMTFFYEKAKTLEGEDVDINEYRYPGPKPLSKEVAIVMLADSAEAASRALEDPKPARIKSLVKRTISLKFESGELENCDLTLRDLHQIEESFSRVLTGIFHRRIVYPEKKPEGVRF